MAGQAVLRHVEVFLHVMHPPARGQAAACWAQLHGLVMLELEVHLRPEKVSENAIEAVLNTFLEGLET